jgi:hypothetical protein
MRALGWIAGLVLLCGRISAGAEFQSDRSPANGAPMATMSEGGAQVAASPTGCGKTCCGFTPGCCETVSFRAEHAWDGYCQKRSCHAGGCRSLGCPAAKGTCGHRHGASAGY